MKGVRFGLFFALIVGCTPGPEMKTITLDAATVFYDQVLTDTSDTWQTYDGKDMHDLHNDCVYLWKMNLDGLLPKDVAIKRVTIHIDGITNTGSDRTDILYISVFDVNPPPSFAPQVSHVVSLPDTTATLQDRADYFSGPADNDHWLAATPFISWEDTDGPAITTNLIFELTPAILATLNSYKADCNWIGIGLDPDCIGDNTNRFCNNDGIRCEITYEE